MRTINIPIMAMLFFDVSQQADLEFERLKVGNVKRFDGLAAPRGDLDDRVQGNGRHDGPGRQRPRHPSHGRIWIDSATGRILRTELISEDTGVLRRSTSATGPQPGLDAAGAGRNARDVRVRGNESRIDGRATYSRFRQFTVTTTEKPKPQ